MDFRIGLTPIANTLKKPKGTRVVADQKIGGGPSVLYDAVAVLPSEAGAKSLLKFAAILKSSVMTG